MKSQELMRKLKQHQREELFKEKKGLEDLQF